MSSQPASDKYLVVKGIAGLGNRIFCALGGILYAQLSGRKLIIDWSDPVCSSAGENSFHLFFRSPQYSSCEQIPVTESIYPAVWRGRMHDSALRVASDHGYNPDQNRVNLSIDIAKIDYAEDVVVLVAYSAGLDRLRPNFRGTLQHLADRPRHAILAEMLRHDLILQPQIRRRVDDFKQEKFVPPTVGVHIRYSDYRVRIFAIIKQLNALLERQPNLQVFLAADNIEITKLFEKNYPGLVTTPHWYSRPGYAIHTSSARPGVVETTIEALLDMYLLAECDYLIYDGSSSFARVADLLSSAPAGNRTSVTAKSKGNRRVRGIVTRIMRRTKFFNWAFRILPKVVGIRRL